MVDLDLLFLDSGFDSPLWLLLLLIAGAVVVMLAFRVAVLTFQLTVIKSGIKALSDLIPKRGRSE